MNKSSLVIVVFILSLCLCPVAHALSNAKLTAKIVDENGTAIQGAHVTLSFSGAKQGDGGGMVNFGKEGFTDNEGLFAGSSGTLPYVGVVADKDGYYRSIQKYEFKSSSLLLNRWEPWNPTIEVVLKKKRNPVAMVINGMDWTAIPKLDTPIGYDLEKGNWVAPYGNGIIADLTFEFNLSSRAYTDYDANLTVTFTNGQDGIQEYWFGKNEQSLFKWPFEAPGNGYKRSVNIFELDNPKDGYKTNKKENVNYIFRVRTKLDKDGNVISAKYGKLEGGFGISPNGKTKFHYFFNLDGTRNIEEDPKKNLLNKK